MNILGIETSCDETAVAIVNEQRKVLSHIVVSQIDIHKEFGGVVPEVAARNHLDILDKVIVKTLEKANLTFDDIDAVSATSGPGLIGGVMVGMMTAKTLASVLKKPFIAVNHLEGHALICLLDNDLDFPFLLFLLSGGHCQILLVNGVGNYEKIGGTIDDALGEAFDKVGQLLGLEYPAGPKIEQLAKNGDENRFKFPKPLISRSGKKKNEAHKFNFSFSGLKTAVRRQIEKLVGKDYIFDETYKKLSKKDIADICASFQKTVVDILKDRFKNVVELLEQRKFWKEKSISTPLIRGDRNPKDFQGDKKSQRFIKANLSSCSPLVGEPKNTSNEVAKCDWVGGTYQKSENRRSEIRNNQMIPPTQEDIGLKSSSSWTPPQGGSKKACCSVQEGGKSDATSIQPKLIISGGVAANQYLKQNMLKICEKYNYTLITPPIKLCTDNGVMIALAGLERMKLGWVDNLKFNPKARWDLTSLKR